MRNAILLTLAGIFLVSLITIAAVYLIPAQQTVPAPSMSETAPQTPDPMQYPYLLRTHEGKLALFTEDLVKPDMIFDVYVRTLPDYDQQQLERGVRVEDFEKLNMLIEDYIS